MLFGFGVWLWCVPALVVLVFLARTDTPTPRGSHDRARVRRPPDHPTVIGWPAAPRASTTPSRGRARRRTDRAVRRPVPPAARLRPRGPQPRRQPRRRPPPRPGSRPRRSASPPCSTRLPDPSAARHARLVAHRTSLPAGHTRRRRRAIWETPYRRCTDRRRFTSWPVPDARLTKLAVRRRRGLGGLRHSRSPT